MKRYRSSGYMRFGISTPHHLSHVVGFRGGVRK